MLIAASTYAAAILVAIAAQPAIQSYAASRSEEYAAAARSSKDLAAKAGNYRLALALSPRNASYRNELATVYIQQNNVEAAISVLGATEGERIRKASYQLSLGRYEPAERTVTALNSSQAAIVRSKIALERGSADKALQAVNPAKNDLERLQMGYSYAAAGNYEAAHRLLAVMADSKPKQQLTRAQNGGVALAQELYRERLFNSAKRVLDKAEGSSEKYVLSAYIQLELPGKDRGKLENARDNLIKGSNQDPSNVKLRQVLVRIYRNLDDKAGVAREEEIIRKLQSGKL